MSFILTTLTLFLYAVGNKIDAPVEKKVVKTEDAQKFAEQIGVALYETSAKENQNVEEVSFSHTWKYSFLKHLYGLVMLSTCTCTCLVTSHHPVDQ